MAKYYKDRVEISLLPMGIVVVLAALGLIFEPLTQDPIGSILGLAIFGCLAWQAYEFISYRERGGKKDTEG